MIVIKQKMVHRSDLRANPHLLYLFGDNEERKGMGGQAQEMRGELNAFGIPTKYSPSRHPTAYWSEETWPKHASVIYTAIGDLYSILNGYEGLVIPSDGIGTGLSDLPRRCPTAFKVLEERLSILETHIMLGADNFAGAAEAKYREAARLKEVAVNPYVDKQDPDVKLEVDDA